MRLDGVGTIRSPLTCSNGGRMVDYSPQTLSSEFYGAA